MKRRLSLVFATAAVLLFGAMCAVTAYNYAALEFCVGCSAPASTAFLLAIPYALGIIICAAAAVVLWKRG